jgi:phage-related tail protein|tara:strand:+ start:1548 stop:1814 length:267 start_codon:yes stop_codon:yes gene_type:complete
MSDDIFDFGFTAVDEDELNAVQEAKTQIKEVTGTATGNQERLDKLYNAIVPLLNNLKKNPEKEYILWPDRLKKVEQFEDHLQKIYQGG